MTNNGRSDSRYCEPVLLSLEVVGMGNYPSPTGNSRVFESHGWLLKLLRCSILFSNAGGDSDDSVYAYRSALTGVLFHPLKHFATCTDQRSVNDSSTSVAPLKMYILTHQSLASSTVSDNRLYQPTTALLFNFLARDEMISFQKTKSVVLAIEA